MEGQARKEHHAQVLIKKGGNPVSETSGLELYVVKKEKRTMFYYHPNTKEQLAKLTAQVDTTWVRSRLYYELVLL